VATEVAIPGHILQISPASTTDEISNLVDGGLVDRTVMPDSYQGRALADVLEQDLGGSAGRRVNLGVEDNSYGKGLADSFTRAWRAKLGLIGQRVTFGARQRSYDDAARQMTAGSPDSWVVFSFVPAYERFSRALVRTGHWDPGKTYGADALALRDLPKLAGADVTEGLRGTAPGSPDNNPATAAFDNLYAASSGARPQTFDAQTFDAVILCYLAAVRAGKVEGQAMAGAVRAISAPPGEKYTWQQLPGAIEALARGQEIDYEGASGPIDLNEAGDPTAGVYDLYRYEQGKITVYDRIVIPKASG